MFVCGFFVCLFCFFVVVGFWFLFFCLLGPYPQHIEVPWLGVKLEPQLPAYVTVIAMLDPRIICDLHCSSQQCQILNPLSEARDRIASLWMLVGFITAEARQTKP